MKIQYGCCGIDRLQLPDATLSVAKIVLLAGGRISVALHRLARLDLNGGRDAETELPAMR
jgi:hypothetical protein